MSEFNYDADSAAYDRLFSPNSVAVIGASDNPMAPGGSVYANLRRYFAGDVLAINHRRTTVQGDSAYRSIQEVGKPIDLVVIATPAETVAEQIEACVAAGVGGAVVVSSGFAESNAIGAAWQDRLTELSADHHFPILGPNCVGFSNAYRGVMADFSVLPGAERPKTGPVAVVSQSGGFGSFILENAVRANLEVGMFVSTGNESSVTVARVVRYLIEWSAIRVLLVFCEGLRDADAFLAAADRASQLGKCIVVLKAGRSYGAARAALSHTASMIGSAEVFDAVCDQFGVACVENLDALIDTGLILQSGKRSTGRRVGVVTASGGAGVLVADALEHCALDLPALPEREQSLIQAELPAFGTATNPVDVTGQLFSLPPARFESVLDVVAASSVIDSVLALFHSGEMFAADAVQRLHQENAKPVVAVTATRSEALTRRGVAAYADPMRAVRALARLTDICARSSSFSARSAAPRIDEGRRGIARDLIADGRRGRVVLEHVSKRLLNAYGLVVPREHVVTSEQEAVRIAREFHGAVALKVLSYDLPHRTDRGAMRLGVLGDDDVAEAFRELTQAFGQPSTSQSVLGILVQEMVPANLELMYGMSRDEVFGPIVAFGLGGYAVELVNIKTLLRAPFTRAEAENALRGYLHGRLVNNARGLGETQVRDVARGLAGLGQMAVELPEVLSVDVNPVRVSVNGPCAVDALIELCID